MAQGQDGSIRVSKAGRLSFWLSMACAVHCAATPLAVSLLPIASGGLFHSLWLEIFLIGGGLAFGLFVLIRDYAKRAERPAPLLVGLLGAGLLASAHSLLPEAWEIPALLTGAVLLGLAQILNARLATACPHPHHHH